MTKYQDSDRDVGWRTIEESEGSGISLVGSYLNYPGSRANAFAPYIGEWGRAYGRAVYAAWPVDVYVDEFVEAKIKEAGLDD